jgi:hypothetical protein
MPGESRTPTWRRSTPRRGQPIPGWSADTTGSSREVWSLAVKGDRVYVGGKFTGIDGTPRKRLAMVDSGPARW